MSAPSLTDCVVCFHLMRHPKSLRCGHSLCSGCATKLTQKSPLGDKINCPVCREQTMLTGTNQKLPTNYALKDLIEKVARNERFQCTACKKPCSEIHSCSDCKGKPKSARICASCVFKQHHTHSVDRVNAVLGDEELTDFLTTAKLAQRDFKEFCDDLREDVAARLDRAVYMHQAKVRDAVAVIESSPVANDQPLPLLSKLKADMAVLDEVIGNGEKSLHDVLNNIRSVLEAHSKDATEGNSS